MPLIGKDVDMIWDDDAEEKLNQQHIAMYVKIQLEVIKCEIIVISLDNFVELHITNAMV